MEISLSKAAGLQEKQGPLLFQLPPTLTFDESLFNAFCRCVPKNLESTIEARHNSWLEDRALSAIPKNRITWRISDTAGRYPYLEAVTAHSVSIRLHGSKNLCIQING